MTTVAPDGAYIIGGGRYNFGQTATEDLARAAFEFDTPSLGNMIELLGVMLEQLPLGALRPFQGFLGLGDSDFQSVSQAVEAIISSLKERPIFMLLADFQQWVMDFIFALTGSIRDGNLTKLADWFKTTVTDVLDTIKTTLTALIDGLWTVIGKVGTGKNVADLITAFTGAWNTLSNGLQGLIDGLVKAFGGTGTTVAAAVTAVTNWLSNVFQKLLDEIAKLLPFELGGWRPGSGAANLHAGIQDVVNAIAGILGVGQKAAAAAGEANLAISVIASAQAGGFHDELDYTLADDMPAAWQKKTPLADSYGPDGKGGIHGVMRGVLGSVSPTGPVQYVQTSKPLTTADMKVTTQLLRKPWWDLLVKSSWYLLVQANPTDRTAYGVDIMNTTCQFFSLNAAGVQTNIGTVKTIPANATNIPYILEIKGTTLKLTIGSVTAATQAVSAPLTGRCVGFGGFKPVYTNLTDNPLAQFSGFTWQPA